MAAVVCGRRSRPLGHGLDHAHRWRTTVFARSAQPGWCPRFQRARRMARGAPAWGTEDGVDASKGTEGGGHPNADVPVPIGRWLGLRGRDRRRLGLPIGHLSAGAGVRARSPALSIGSENHAASGVARLPLAPSWRRSAASAARTQSGPSGMYTPAIEILITSPTHSQADVR